MLVEKKLGPKGTPPGLVANIPKGMRAFALDVTEQSGVSGFILPGHHVDVVRYESEQGVRAARRSSRTSWSWPPARSSSAPRRRASRRARSPLAVTPDQVNTLVAARAKGSLSLSLRGLNDQAVVARPKPKAPAEDPLEKRWKLEEERRKALERGAGGIEVRAGEEGRRAAPPPPAAATAGARYVDHLSGPPASPRALRSTRPRAERSCALRPRPSCKAEARDRPGRPAAAPRVASGPGRRRSRTLEPRIAAPVADPNRSAGLRESNTMKDVIRIVLVDPTEESRDALQRLLGRSARSGSPRSSIPTRMHRRASPGSHPT